MTVTESHACVATWAPAYPEPEPWRDQARCKGAPIDVFFPAPSGPAQYDAARVICASCPVLAECREATWDVPEGFVGGLTPLERRKRRRRLTVVSCAVCGVPFDTPRNRPVARYCSEPCRNEGRRRLMARSRA